MGQRNTVKLELEILGCTSKSRYTSCDKDYIVRIGDTVKTLPRPQLNKLLREDYDLIGIRRIKCINKIYVNDHNIRKRRIKYTIKFLDTGEVLVLPGKVLWEMLHEYKLICDQVYAGGECSIFPRGDFEIPEITEAPILTPEEIAKIKKAELKEEQKRQRKLEEEQRQLSNRLKRNRECQLELVREPHELQQHEISRITTNIVDICLKYNINTVSLQIKGKVSEDFTTVPTGQIGNGIVYNAIRNYGILYITVYPDDCMRKLTLPEDSKFLFQNYMGLVFIKNKIRVDQIILDGVYWDNVVQAEGMFAWFPASSIRIIGQVAYNLQDLSKCFSRQRIRQVEFRAFKTSKIKQTYRMFYGCRNLRLGDIKIRQLNFDSVDRITEMFKGCGFNPYDLVDDITIRKLEDAYGYNFTTTWVPHSRLDSLGCVQIILSKCHWKGYNKQEEVRLSNNDFDVFSTAQQSKANKKVG